MSLDDKKIVYYRTYDNILNILGIIGGLFDSLLAVVGFLINPLA